MKISHRSSFPLPLLPLLPILIINFRISIAGALGNETDRFALLEFKVSITEDPRGILGSWNDSVHFCKWRGIRCTGTRVTILDLADQSLSGHVSPFLGNLSALWALDLTNNSFSGQIPPQLGRLSRLRDLRLAINLLEGKIPGNLSSCSELESLMLGRNNLSGTIPPELQALTKLEALNLESNDLSGGIPIFVGNMSSLTAIYLSFSNLTGTIPEEIGRLRSLSVFSVGPNNLYGTIPLSFYNLSSLTSLTITDNDFHGEIPALKLPDLVEFYIGGNRFSGKIPGSLSNSSRLLQIDVSDNEFAGEVPASLGKLSLLEWLLLNDNKLGGQTTDHSLDFIESLTNCSNLKVLVLSSNNFGGILPRSISNLSNHMTRIYLADNRLSGRIDHVKFENLPNLEVVSMTSNHFSGEIPASLTKLKSLRALVLERNAFTGKIPTLIGNLTQVFGLSLQHNRLEGDIPSSIGDCQSLQFLDLSDNNLSGEVPIEVFSIESLISVNFSHNLLSGKLPGEVGGLRKTTYIDLSENNLAGDIPGRIGDCESLEYIFLQGNSFQGRLPQNLASLQALQYLDLSRNNLSGKIPADLAKLTILISLNLSFNNLEGELPNGSLFQNATALSLIGNPKLCGGILEFKLPRCLTATEDLHRGKSPRVIIIAVCLGVIFFIFSILALLYLRRRLSQKTPNSEEEGIRFLAKVSYQTLYEATNGFSPGNLIGAGSFGSVYKGILDGIESPVAIKVLNLGRKGAEKSFLAECEALRNVKHRNLVKVLTCCSSVDHKGDDFKALVFEHMSNGSLDKWLHGSEPSEMSLNMIQRLNIGVDVALAIQYLHEDCDESVIHCDLKPGNVLLDEEMTARVCDFGLARLTNEGVSEGTTSGIKGTIGYAAPEYAMGGKASKSGDMYSYGMFLLELFTGKRPTDDMFRDDFNLRSFVCSALSGRVMQVVDKAMEITTRSHHDDDDKCLASVLKIGIACSEDSPSERMRIGDVTRELHRLRNDYYGLPFFSESQINGLNNDDEHY